MAFIKGIKCYETHVAEQINFELSDLHQSIVAKLIFFKKVFSICSKHLKEFQKCLVDTICMLNWSHQEIQCIQGRIFWLFWTMNDQLLLICDWRYFIMSKCLVLLKCSVMFNVKKGHYVPNTTKLFLIQK